MAHKEFSGSGTETMRDIKKKVFGPWIIWMLQEAGAKLELGVRKLRVITWEREDEEGTGWSGERLQTAEQIRKRLI